MSAKRSTGGRTHRFGGDWTTAKLDVIARYLASYTTALKDKPSKETLHEGLHRCLRRHRVSRCAARRCGGEAIADLAVPRLAEPEPQAFLDGSTRLALKTEPRFDRYMFIEPAPSGVHNSKR